MYQKCMNPVIATEIIILHIYIYFVNKLINLHFIPGISRKTDLLWYT